MGDCHNWRFFWANVQWAIVKNELLSNGRLSKMSDCQMGDCPMGDCPTERLSKMGNCQMGDCQKWAIVKWAIVTMGDFFERMSNGRLSNGRLSVYPVQHYTTLTRITQFEVKCSIRLSKVFQVVQYGIKWLCVIIFINSINVFDKFQFGKISIFFEYQNIYLVSLTWLWRRLYKKVMYIQDCIHVVYYESGNGHEPSLFLVGKSW